MKSLYLENRRFCLHYTSFGILQTLSPMQSSVRPTTLPALLSPNAVFPSDPLTIIQGHLPHKGHLAISRGIFVARIGGGGERGGVLKASSGQRPGMMLRNCTGKPPTTKKPSPQMSIIPVLRNSLLATPNHWKVTNLSFTCVMLSLALNSS